MAGRRMIDDLQLYNTIFYSVARIYKQGNTNTSYYNMTYTLVLFGKEFRLNIMCILYYTLYYYFTRQV